LGTPKGRGKLYDFYMRGQSDDPEWKSWLLTGDKSGLFAPMELLNMQNSMTQAMYAQEIMCSFLENEGVVFRGVREAMTGLPEAPKKEHMYVLGVDLAKVTDYTVVTVYDRTNNHQVFQSRWQTIEWPFQKAKIIELAKHYNNALTVLDATGIGDPIADDLIRVGVAVTPFKITEQTKKDLIEKLSIWIEQKKCMLLPMEESLKEFDNFSYEIGPTGKVRYQARDGYHDDIVIAHALAVSALQPIVKEQTMPEMTRVQKAFIQAKEQYRRGVGYETTQEGWDAE
jgi:phage FluMu gp28-like protein